VPKTAMDLSEEQKAKAIELAVEGESIGSIIEMICVSPYNFWRARQHDPLFAKLFEQARQEGLEHIADNLLTVHDEYEDVQRARLFSDNSKWLLSKRKPQIYGDRLDVNISQTIDIGSALAEARKRAQLPESQIKDVTPDAIAISSNEDDEQ